MRATVSTFNNRKPYLAFPPLPDMKEATQDEVKDWYEKYRTWYDDLVKILQKDREELNKVLDDLGDTSISELTDRVGTLETEVTADGTGIDTVTASVSAINSALTSYVTSTALAGMFSGEQLGKKLVDYNNLINVPAVIPNKHYQFKGSLSGTTNTGTTSPATLDPIPFTESYDPYDVFASNTFTVPVTGYYHLTASISVVLNTGAGALSRLDVLVTNTANTNIDYGTRTGATTGGIYAKTSSDHLLTAGDTARIRALVTWTGGATSWDIVGGPGLYFSGHLIEAT